MIFTTTSSIEGYPVKKYLGVVSGEAVLGANVIRDFFANITDTIGGRSGSYEDTFLRAKEYALDAVKERALAAGANAVIGIDLDYQVLGKQNSMMMVTATGTAVIV